MTRIQYQDCIDACLKCMNACNSSYVSSLKEYDLALLRDCIRMDRECADICAYAIQAMTRQSPYVADICSLCADICEATAKECGRYEQTHCRNCIDACLDCAKACREISEAVAVLI
ncbi:MULTISPECIES: four-helix bundle copper-binding protein [Paenibacillus]|uniref:Four-helix bundle copper-binding protein n=1 Tax=Paenibacillus rhizophilus TaxID=1850366 RepID=A0A3N9PAI7_9BACL|nr:MULTISPECIES: four-helix bundle copper-binding protein [Paenibacillus]RQW13231.1 four-helix bundle copper-binding protein [Paenibacillus rhizophilus]BCG59579.1 putative cysteine-rich protein YhjQ [Paenibacillus sp. URB8-2]